MKGKWLKRIFIGLVVLAALLIVILLFSLRLVDETPYFENKYYSETLEELNNALGQMKPVKGEIQAGFGRMSITPTLSAKEDDPAKGIFAAVSLAGFGARSGPAAAVHDSIFVRAVALKIQKELLVLISGDILLMPPEVADRVSSYFKNQIGLKREQIFFGGTHSHSSLGGWSPGYVGEEVCGKYQPAMVSWLSEKVQNAIQRALSDLRPARIGSRSFRATDFVRNRMIGKTGRLNDQMTFLFVDQIEGRKAVLGAFAAHATVLGASNLEVSGDYPGYWERRLEAKGIYLAVFFAGTVGSHTNHGKGRGFEKARYIGESLADSVLKYLGTTEEVEAVSFASFGSPLQIPRLQILRLTNRICLAPWLGKKLLKGFNTPYIQALRLGKLIWITQPVELSGEFGIDLKNALALRGYHSIISVFNGSYLGYSVPQKYYNHHSYESSLMSWFGPTMGEYIMELNYTACNSLINSRL